MGHLVEDSEHEAGVGGVARGAQAAHIDRRALVGDRVTQRSADAAVGRGEGDRVVEREPREVDRVLARRAAGDGDGTAARVVGVRRRSCSVCRTSSAGSSSAGRILNQRRGRPS